MTERDPSAARDTVIRLRDAGVSIAALARTTGASRRTVDAWLRRQRAPSDEQAARLVELAAIVDRAATVIKPDYIPIWLCRSVPALDGERPIDLIARGEFRRVEQILSGLEQQTAT